MSNRFKEIDPLPSNGDYKQLGEMVERSKKAQETSQPSLPLQLAIDARRGFGDAEKIFTRSRDSEQREIERKKFREYKTRQYAPIGILSECQMELSSLLQTEYEEPKYLRQLMDCAQRRHGWSHPELIPDLIEKANQALATYNRTEGNSFFKELKDYREQLEQRIKDELNQQQESREYNDLLSPEELAMVEQFVANEKVLTVRLRAKIRQIRDEVTYPLAYAMGWLLEVTNVHGGVVDFRPATRVTPTK